MDRDLVEQASRGNREAFGALARVHADRLYAIAQRILREIDRSEDAVQQALVIAWQELPRLRDPDRFEPWLHRLLVRCCYREARQRRDWGQHVRILPLDGLSAPDEAGALANRDQIDRGFRRLPPEQRAILVLHHYLGLSSGEIAAVEPSLPSAAASPRVLPMAQFMPVSPGSYSLSEFPVDITFEIPAAPANWYARGAGVGVDSDEDIPRAQAGEDIPPGAGVSFQIVDNVVANPCSDSRSAELLDPPVGPSVDDLVTAISGLQGFEATAPMDITVSGFEGVELTLTAPDTECTTTWGTADGTHGVAPGEINLLRILDVEGVRVVIAGAYYPATPDDAVAAVEQVMDSVQIEP